MAGFLRFFRRFPQINVGGDSAHFPPLENAPVNFASRARKSTCYDKGPIHILDYLDLKYRILKVSTDVNANAQAQEVQVWSSSSYKFNES